MRILFFISALFLSLCTSAGIVVKGHIQGVNGKAYGHKEFKIEIVEDFITFKKRTITTGKSGKHGDFNVTLNLNETSYLFISFDKVQRTFYAEPAKSYYIDIKVPLEGLTNKERAFSVNIESANIINTHKKELNYLIDTLDYACSNFLKNYRAERKDEKRVALFLESLQVEFEQVKSTFFKDYLRYKQAELLQYSYRKNRKEFATKYFDRESKLAGHIQKMQVFSSFFKGNLRFNILINDRSPFHDMFKKGNLEACLRLIYSSQGASRELRELLLLKGIYEVHSQEYYKLGKVVTMLNKIEQGSTFMLHREIAKHIREKITHLKESYPAPKLLIEGKEKFELASNKNNYVYLCFFRAWDDSFDKEVEVMEMLKRKYGDQLDIVCISVDQDTIKFAELKRKYNNGILFLHYNFQSEILFDFNVEDFRLDRYDKESAAKYYFIDPDGYLVFSPAKTPTKGFHNDLKRILSQ